MQSASYLLITPYAPIKVLRRSMKHGVWLIARSPKAKTLGNYLPDESAYLQGERSVGSDIVQRLLNGESLYL